MENIKISLAAARVNAGYTQNTAAKALGKGNQTICNWENGKTEIDLANFEALCNLYKIPKDYILLPKKSS